MLTPEQLAEFRAECDERLADPDKASPGFIDITIDQLLTHIVELDAALADARRAALLDAASAVDVDGSEVDYEEVTEPAGRRHAADQILGMAERHEPVLSKYRERLIHEIADHAADVINSGTIAELAAPSGVPETGRSEAVAARDLLYEEPVEWLRALAGKDPQ